MTQILNSEVQVRIQLERIDQDLFSLAIKKGKVIVNVVVSDVEASQLSNELNLLITNQ